MKCSKGVQVLIVSFIFLSSAASAQPADVPSINDFIEKRLDKVPSVTGQTPKLQDLCDIRFDPIAERVFREYGAVFVVSDDVKFPPKCVFGSDAEVEDFQTGLETEVIPVNGTPIELQKAAAAALRAATLEASGLGKRITALDGSIAGKRNYRDTMRIWNSRFFRALDHWVAKGKIARSEANYVASLPTKEQIKRVMSWEAAGYYFSTNFSMSIFNSVAPPGTSQHLSLIAFDVVESSDPEIRQILNKHGWFQTIRSDEPHFTYLGVPETQLPARGLTQFLRGGRTYWVPSLKSM